MSGYTARSVRITSDCSHLRNCRDKAQDRLQPFLISGSWRGSSIQRTFPRPGPRQMSGWCRQTASQRMKKTKRIREKKEELCITHKSPPLKVARYRSAFAAAKTRCPRQLIRPALRAVQFKKDIKRQKKKGGVDKVHSRLNAPSTRHNTNSKPLFGPFPTLQAVRKTLL